MFKFVSTFVVLAFIGIGASNQAFAEAKANCITKPWQCKGSGAGKGAYQRDLPSAGAAKVSGKPIKGISDVHEQYEKPINRHGGCDRNMGGCIDH